MKVAVQEQADGRRKLEVKVPLRVCRFDIFASGDGVKFGVSKVELLQRRFGEDVTGVREGGEVVTIRSCWSWSCTGSKRGVDFTSPLREN